MLASRRIASGDRTRLRRAPATAVRARAAAPPALPANRHGQRARGGGLPKRSSCRPSVTTHDRARRQATATANTPARARARSARCSSQPAAGWSGPWNADFKQYEIFAIEGETPPVRTGSAGELLLVAVGRRQGSRNVGACEAELHAGDRVLFVPVVLRPGLPERIDAPCSSSKRRRRPTSANRSRVTVTRYDRNGEGTPASAAVLTGGSEAGENRLRRPCDRHLRARR